MIVGPGVRFPLDPGRAVRAVPSDDPAELAAALAEVLADATERRELAESGTRYAEWFQPQRVAAMIADGVRPLAA